MSEDTAFEEINEAKANMDYIYNQPDPRAYFRELRKLGYAIPGAAKPIFQKLISNLRRRRSHAVHLLDLGCSYGVNAALLKHDLSMLELYEHWGEKALAAAAPEAVVARDRRFFGNLDDQEDISVMGLDQAESAVAFAEETGLLDEGLAVNLETGPPPEAAMENLALVDLVTSTGCVGYLTQKSFEHLLPAVTQGQSPWIGNFVLRMFPFDAIEETLKSWGYVTEKLEGQFFDQRRFASAEEQEQVIEQLRENGIDPTGKETEGHLLAEFYLSRPANETAEAPIERLLAA
ncbi:MAG: class I SAM-dependent methyltransferase [Alphaproteobacteria bacterium]